MGKAGSSSIQATLHRNRNALKKQGIVWPKAAHQEGCNFGRLASELSEPDSVEAPALLELSELLQESATQRVVISSEHLQRLGRAGVERLRDVAESAGHETKVIAYIREYRGWARSKYFQRVRMRGVETKSRRRKRKELNFDKYYPNLLNLVRVRDWISPWGEGFGREALHVRFIDALPGGDVVDDFFEVARARRLVKVQPSNVSPHWLLVELVRAMFECEPSPGTLGRSKAELGPVLQDIESRIGSLQVRDANYLTQPQAEELTAAYRSDAQWLNVYAGVPIPPIEETTSFREFLPSVDAAPARFWLALHEVLADEAVWQSAPYVVTTLERVIGRSARRRSVSA